jgi:hypothetical protein
MDTPLVPGDRGRIRSRVLLGAALGVLILYAITVVALGTPPSVADPGGKVVS